jgi:hypothetical protein
MSVARVIVKNRVLVNGLVAIDGVVTVTGTVAVTGAGDATAANQVTGNSYLSDIDAKIISLDSKVTACNTSNVDSLTLATVAKQPSLGTAGTASVDVITVQGIVGMTALKVDGSAVTQPISGTVAVSGSVAVTGPLTDAELRATPVPVSGTVAATQSGTWTVQPGNTQNTTAWLMDLRRGQTILFAAISASANGANTIVTADATRKIKVLGYTIVADGTVTTTWKSDSTSLSGAMSWVANTGVSPPLGTPASGWIMETAVNEALILTLSAAVGVRGQISYFLEA